MGKKDMYKYAAVIIVTLILADRLRSLPLVSKLPTV